MSNHAWCSDPARDEAVRAAEDGRLGPLPTLEEAIADPFTKTARICETESAVEPVIPAADAQGGGVAGLRTERVTLEITMRAESYAPCRDLDWQRMLRQTPGGLFPGESVRVVDDRTGTDMGNGVFVASTEEVLAMCRETEARLTAERDAALRERDAANEECGRLRAERDDALLVLPACCGRLSDAAATVVQERDHARSRVAELLKDCETYQRAVLALQGQCDLANARVAELESAPNTALAANAGGEKQGPVAWGVLLDSGRGLYGHYDCEPEARGVCEAVNAEENLSLSVVPLYAAPVAESATTPQPPRGWLTERERDRLHRIAHFLEDRDRPVWSEVVRGILARPTPPEVVLPVCPYDGYTLLKAEYVWGKCVAAFAAALAAAGVKVKEVGCE